MTDLLSTAPYVYSSFFSLLQTAGAAASPPVTITPFLLEEYEPTNYIILSGVENHRYNWESIGAFSQTEHYSINGIVTVYVGDSPDQYNTGVAISVLNSTYTLFDTIVMTTVMSNRLAPVLANTYPNAGAVYNVLPGYARYSAAPGVINGVSAGWAGAIEFSFDFDAYITPA